METDTQKLWDMDMLKLYEFENVSVLKVPGGWVFQTYQGPVFVPYSESGYEYNEEEEYDEDYGEEEY